ncbi:MAG: non-hydrolyzing UDP-N-acetylglucosamine 2-epimerase [Actinomycetota bacterium]
MLIFGTRPEAIKVAPLIKALEASPHFRPVVAVTAQHREMLDQVLDLFGIVPDHDLDMIQPRQSLTDVTVRALGGLSPLIEEVSPDAVVVQGDTTTTFTGALAAFYHQVPVVHMEAGLRTGQRYSPFPEEINRCLTSRLTQLHLAPTSTSRDNLIRENVDPADIMVTGNTVIDALLWAVDQRVGYDDPLLEELDAGDERIVLVTAHRRESWGSGMESIGAALRTIALEEPGVRIVFPIHRNPVVREAIMPAVEGLSNVSIVEPLAYGAFSRLLHRAHIVLTDSGGIQEEAPSLGKPVLVMRDSTERPEAMEAGTVRLVGADRTKIVNEVMELLHDAKAYDAMANAVNPYGDGWAAERSVQALAHLFGLAQRPPEFTGDRQKDPRVATSA